MIADQIWSKAIVSKDVKTVNLWLGGQKYIYNLNLLN